MAAANLTRPILPKPGGVRQVNTIMNLGATMIPQKHEGVIYIRPPVS